MIKVVALITAMLMQVGCGLVQSKMQRVTPPENSDAQSIISANRVFIPEGFDDNDNVDIVLDGWVNNGCYKVIEPKTQVNLENQSIEVIPQAILENELCTQARIRFTSVAKIGVLPVGTYHVYTNDHLSDQILEVKEARSAGPDDYVYAQVDQATVEFAPENDDSKWSVVIEGRLTNTCQSLGKIEVVDSGDTVQVLPILDVANRPDCEAKEIHFLDRAFLPEYSSPGRHLLHVRSASGNSVNEVFSTFGGIE